MRTLTTLAFFYYAASLLNHALHSHAFECLQHSTAVQHPIQPCIESSRALVRTYSMRDCARLILIWSPRIYIYLRYMS